MASNGSSRCVPVLSLAIVLLGVVGAAGHPIPRQTHDRTVIVRVTRDALLVDFRLEVDETWAFRELADAITVEERTRITTPAECHAAYLRWRAPLIADGLVATLNGQLLEFHSLRQSYQLLDHLRCEYVFQAKWQLKPGTPHRCTFTDETFKDDQGRLNLSLLGDGATLLETVQPDEALKSRAIIDQQPGDRDRLRRATSRFVVDGETLPVAQPEASAAPQLPESDPEKRRYRLLNLFLDSRHGFWALLLLSAWFGAAHALEPGHGKTLVAAYLVGERGTAWHAVLLGLVTTLTHTGVVLALAVSLLLFFPGADPAEVPPEVQSALGFAGGLLVAGLGFWLIFRCLRHQPGHVHMGGHHHHHGSADHYHDEHGHAHPLPPRADPTTWWGLVLLGITGGMVPCGAAIALFSFAWSAHGTWLSLMVLLAFSAGLASVLVLIGVLVVYVKGFADSRMGSSRLLRMLPLLSAIVVTCLGLWLCYESGH